MEPLNPGHQPQRFFHYSEQEDGKGFTIPGTDYVFKFDRFGGWFDEYQNYYNQDGEPDSQPPSESDSEHYSSENGDYFSQGSSSEDEYENSYGPPKELPLE